MRIAFFTLGCKVNHYESQAMQELFEKAGWEITDADNQSDVYLINTCSVTAVSDKKSRQLISQAYRKNPDALIAVCGCYAQTAPEKVEKLPGVALVLGNEGKADIVRKVEEAFREKTNAVRDIFEARDFEELSAIADSRTRATLKIQDGCSNFCSYCIIPYARGPIRSRKMESIERELTKLAENGFVEVVLTGIHLASYGKDFKEDPKPDFLDVLKLANGIEGLERIRIGSIEPKFCDERFAKEVSGLGKVCRQFHLSLQSGSDTVLKRMNRHYTTSEYREAVDTLRKYMPDCAITTDVIAGFVGETEEEFAETLQFLKEIRFARTHVFPYSRRPGTKADRMEGHLEKSVKEERARQLIHAAKELEEAFVEEQIGTVQTVIVENDGTGYTGNYVRVQTGGKEGEFKRIRITGRKENIAFGEEV